MRITKRIEIGPTTELGKMIQRLLAGEEVRATNGSELRIMVEAARLMNAAARVLAQATVSR